MVSSKMFRPSNSGAGDGVTPAAFSRVVRQVDVGLTGRFHTEPAGMWPLQRIMAGTFTDSV